MNDENLKPITNTKQARERGSKGGRSRSLAKRMINRKFCNSRCPLFNNCWVKHTAHSLHEKAIVKAEEEGLDPELLKAMKPKCALKELPTQVIEGANRIILDGEEGFNNEMMEQIMRLKSDLMIGNFTAKDMERYLYQLRETKKSIYGDKNRFEGVVDTNIITVNDFAEAYNKSKQKEADKKNENKG